MKRAAHPIERINERQALLPNPLFQFPDAKGGEKKRLGAGKGADGGHLPFRRRRYGCALATASAALLAFGLTDASSC